MNTKDWLFKWLDIYAKNNIKSRTYTRYREIIEQHLCPIIGDLELADIGIEEVRVLLNGKLKCGNLRNGNGLAGSSVNTIITVLKNALDAAEDCGLIDRNPCVKVKRVNTGEKKVEAFTQKEQKQIENYIIHKGDVRLYGIIICLYTGMRIGELLALEWGDIDMRKNVIVISKTVYSAKDKDGIWTSIIDEPRTKSSVREIPLPENIKPLLRELKSQSSVWQNEAKNTRKSVQIAPTERIITNKRGPMSVRSYQFIFESLLAKIGIQKRGFHSLRHTFATRAIECGIDIKTISEILGHKNTAITLNRYAHSHMETKQKAIKKLAKIF